MNTFYCITLKKCIENKLVYLYSLVAMETDHDSFSFCFWGMKIVLLLSIMRFKEENKFCAFPAML